MSGKFLIPPTLADALEAVGRDWSNKLRVSLPGEIISFDSTKRTAAIMASYNRVLPDGTETPVTAQLLDVPVFTLQGGGLHVGLPIEPGDECWVTFCDFNIDAWHSAGGQQTPQDYRRHDIADGFAVVGPNSLANALVTALLDGEGGLSSDTAKVAINKETGLITISNETQDLATILTNMITAIQVLNAAIAAMTTASISAGVPQAAATANEPLITEVLTSIPELLY